jgi:glycine oxidase
MPAHSDCLIVGGGVIGLSLAWELARQKLQVTVIDQGQTGREASWAGAGILPPVNPAAARDPYDHLRGLSYDLHPRWAAELGEMTGIDTGYRRCGGLYLARTSGEAAALAGWASVAADEQIGIERVTPAELAQLEPAIRTDGRLRGIYNVPSEAQLRNPRHLKALRSACEIAGVSLLPEVCAKDLVLDGERVVGLETSAGRMHAGNFCLTAGAWTGNLLARMGVRCDVLPMRGQMLLLRCAERPFRRVLNEGSRYMVPRDDGLVLVGSTEEEVGFDKSTTEEGLADLRRFADDLVPILRDARLERSWAGLRPASFDGLPYMGQLPGLSNAYVAAGHFRSGLYLSPGTAVVMRQRICGQSTDVDLRPFRIGR